jgi:hypothetical protein
LASGIVVGQLPIGELCYAIFGYLGGFMAIGTSLGARIASVDDSGNLTIGPLLWEAAVHGFTARGTFIWAAVASDEFDTDTSGAYRIDLSTELEPLRYPYATDLIALTGDDVTNAVAFWDDLLLMGCDGGGFQEDITDFLDDGWLQTSRIRFGTLEPKVYKLLRVRADELDSAFIVSIIPPDGTTHTVVGYAAGQTPGTTDVGLPNLGSVDYVSLRFDLESTGDNLTSVVTSGYQLKALPAQPRQRLIRIPLWCFDRESDRNGNVREVIESAFGRMLALEALDRAADAVKLQDLDRNSFEDVLIEEVTFTQTAPPPGSAGWGGLIQLTVRTV